MITKIRQRERERVVLPRLYVCIICIFYICITVHMVACHLYATSLTFNTPTSNPPPTTEAPASGSRWNVLGCENPWPPCRPAPVGCCAKQTRWLRKSWVFLSCLVQHLFGNKPPKLSKSNVEKYITRIFRVKMSNKRMNKQNLPRWFRFMGGGFVKSPDQTKKSNASY